MSVALDLLKADHMGVRDLKEHLSTKILNKILVITDRGVPVSVNLPYSDVLELTDLVDEISDLQTLTTINEARKAIKNGTKGISVSKLFRKSRIEHR